MEGFFKSLLFIVAIQLTHLFKFPPLTLDFLFKMSWICWGEWDTFYLFLVLIVHTICLFTFPNLFLIIHDLGSGPTIRADYFPGKELKWNFIWPFLLRIITAAGLDKSVFIWIVFIILNFFVGALCKNSHRLRHGLPVLLKFDSSLLTVLLLCWVLTVCWERTIERTHRPLLCLQFSTGVGRFGTHIFWISQRIISL